MARVIMHKRDVWTMHLLAVVTVAILSLVAIVSLTVMGDAVPESITISFASSVAYLLGTQTNAKFGQNGEGDK